MKLFMTKLFPAFIFTVILFLSLASIASAAYSSSITLNGTKGKCRFISYLANSDGSKIPTSEKLTNAKQYFIKTEWNLDDYVNNYCGSQFDGYTGARVGYIVGSAKTIKACFLQVQADSNGGRFIIFPVTEIGTADKEINKYVVPINQADPSCAAEKPENANANGRMMIVQGSLVTDPNVPPTKPPDKPPTTPPHTPGNQLYYPYDLTNFDKPAGTLNNLLDIQSVPQFLVRLAKIVFILLGGVAAIVILVGAFRMVMSQGNQEGLTSAKRNITWAVIGLVVALLSYSIVAILQSFLGVN